tara:strand:+ start:211 stop:666 length:456 start_codon:yes stop_codon:yes gene_type:complete
MLTKRCEICGNSFSCYSDEKTCWCKEVSIDAEKSNIISNFGIDCFCENCITELKDSKLTNSNQEIKINTVHGIMQLVIKKKKTGFLIEIHDKKYRYPLLSENVNDENNAIMKFTQYNIKLKNNQFKIIRNIEALDENYRRVFSRVRYGILF